MAGRPVGLAGDTGPVTRQHRAYRQAYQFGLSLGFETAAAELRELLREAATSDNGDGRQR